MLRNKRIWVSGHAGLVGSAIMRHLHDHDCTPVVASRRDLDLRDQKETERWIKNNQPDAIIIAAATVGGIKANIERPADFLYDNMMIAANIIHAAANRGVSKLLFLGSSCIYPRNAQQPIIPDSLLSAPLEPSNEFYAIAKIAGIKLCQAYRAQNGCDFVSAMPCNLYGPGDRFDRVRSHVIPAMILKFHQAKITHKPYVSLWGTGEALREFLHVDDLARALVMVLGDYSAPTPVNIGSGDEVSIQELASMIADIVGYPGDIVFDPDAPEGVRRKVINSDVIRQLGWCPRITLRDGLEGVYKEYLEAGTPRAA